MSVPQANGDVDPLQAFVEETFKELQQTQRELKEIDILIKQSAAEVERWTQRNAQAANDVRQMQSNLETTPRTYIREKFETQQNTQQRLFTMRGQLEKLQSDQRNMERLAEFQRRLIDSTAGMTAATDKPGGKDPSGIVRVIQTQEAERQILVRKMHDGPASSLSNFILQAEICQRLFDTDPTRARAELNALKTAAASTFGAVKDFIFDLRPMMLDDLGAIPTLRRYVERFQEKTSIPVSLNVTGTEKQFDSHIDVIVFRAAQELLSNAREHSQASQIQVSVDMEHERVTVVVEDNGSGFYPEEVLNNRDKIGLSSLRERIDMLGGTMDIQSSIGQGTRVELTIPAVPE